MRRRELVTGALAAGWAANAWSKSPELTEAAREAFIYTLPMVEIARVRGRLFGLGVHAGQFFGQPRLATPDSRVVTTPNNDTVYASAFVDLSAGPATITVPPLGDRYGSLAIMDMVSDNVAVLGTRTTGQAGGVFTLVGPTSAGTVDSIRSPTPWVWLVARVIVNGANDLLAAKSALAGFKVVSAPAGPSAPGADRTGTWADYFRVANALLLENPPPATDRAALQRMDPLGLNSRSFDPARFKAQAAAEIAAGVDQARNLVIANGFGGRKIGGWIFQASDAGQFFQDYHSRAQIAVSGIGMLPPAEAMYLTAVPPDGASYFTGDHLWRIRFAQGLTPPVDAFWSLTMYEAASRGDLYLARNSINRYSIGDRTIGLDFGRDGSLDIWISRTDPGGAKSANWLPAPDTGPFSLILRAYLPKAELLTEQYAPPNVEIA